MSKASEQKDQEVRAEAFSELVGTLKMKEWRSIRTLSGFGMTDLADETTVMNEDFLCALYTVVKQRSEPNFPFSTTDDLTVEQVMDFLSGAQ